ncbi:hypothetical protein F4778DRAFT_751583 [Xylariomycetidae sp. FL2044]|nr:hypothetical protein F4778DRAFT_751583 [Xylariomycetidae sp. FL2044]
MPPRAIEPFLRASSNLILDQLLPRSTREARGKLSSRPISAATSSSICIRCRYNFASNNHIRFYSTPKQPNDSTVDDSSEDRPYSPPSTEGSSTRNSSGPTEPSSSSSSQQPQSEPGNEASQNDPPSSTASPPNTELPSTLNAQRSPLNQSLSGFMDRMQTTLFAASQRLNDLTGYSGIETLKTQISTLESRLGAAQAGLHGARTAYKAAVAERSSTQREVTTLLARQKTWTPADFERFTTLYRQDYELEARVAETAAGLADAEREAERLGRELSHGILARYHEEQIWSDKIRRMSTWGTWGLMGVNVLLFLVFQFGAEPWRRQRLVRGFEEKVREALEEDKLARAQEREEHLRDQAASFSSAAAAAAAAAATPEATGMKGGEDGEAATTTETSTGAPMPNATIVTDPESIPEVVVEEEPPPTWREVLTDPGRWKAALADLQSDRKVAIRMRDVSLIALQGVVAGAAVAGTIAAAVLVRRS